MASLNVFKHEEYNLDVYASLYVLVHITLHANIIVAYYKHIHVTSCYFRMTMRDYSELHHIVERKKVLIPSSKKKKIT